MASIIILTDETSESHFKKFNQIVSKNMNIYSFNLQNHKILKSKKVSHFIADEFLDDNERSKLFDLSMKYATNWYKSAPQ